MPDSGYYFEKEAKKHGLKVRRGKGSHVIVEGPEGRGYMTFPLKRELGIGLSCKIKKWFKALGILLLFALPTCACLASFRLMP